MPHTKFGVEIEGSGSRTDINAALQEVGLVPPNQGVDTISYGQSQLAVKSDGSVPDGFEVVFPPMDLRSKKDLSKLALACQTIKDAGGRTSKYGGIHIHIDKSGMSNEDLANAARLCFKYEDAFFRIATSGWRSLRPRWHEFAPAWSSDIKKQLVNVNFEGDTVRQLCRRYNGFTFHTSHNTVEFRVFNSSLSAPRIRGYVALCSALFTAAKLGVDTAKVDPYSCYPLGGMAEGWRDEVEVLTKLLRTLKCRGYGLSDTDAKLLKTIWKESVPQLPQPTMVLDDFYGDNAVKNGKKRDSRSMEEILGLQDASTAVLGDEQDPTMSVATSRGPFRPDRNSYGECHSCGYTSCLCCSYCGSMEWDDNDDASCSCGSYFAVGTAGM